MTSLAVEYAELAALATALRWQCDQVGDHALSLTTSAASGDIAQAVLLAPVEAAAAEGAILEAAVKADLMVLELGARALATDTAAELYRLADEIAQAGSDAAAAVREKAAEEWAEFTAWAYEEAYPWLIDSGITVAIIGAQVVLVDQFGLPLVFLATGGHWPTLSHEEAAAGLLALLDKIPFHDIDPELRAPDLKVNGAYDGKPVDLEQLMNFETDAYNKPTGGSAQPQVVITKVVGPDGVERWIVNIPGTEPSRILGPTGIDTDLATMGSATNASEQSELSQAIVAAMKAAGVDDSGLDVMLSGHSLGGMVAADIASDPELVERFNITAVTTQGSPIAHYPITDGVEVLAFEHNQDPVPQLDGSDNPDRPNWTTVAVDNPTRSIDPLDSHGQDQYTTTMAGERDPDTDVRSGGYVVAPDSAISGFMGTVESQQTSRLEEK